MTSGTRPLPGQEDKLPRAFFNAGEKNSSTFTLNANKGSAKASACADYHLPGVRCDCTAPRGLVSRYSGPNLATTPLQESVCGRAASGPRGDSSSVLPPRERRGQTQARTHVRGARGQARPLATWGAPIAHLGRYGLPHTHTHIRK